ncbi:hypothetical protein PSECIP111951_02235 [Pseudoalteromonas holothuriae]|uniref:LamG-like jellyroll fold domain-containing protein n=2 Tax=Pseudoalteromonas holothuriae TaxID=2963714 RepID=A0ABM9GIZ7_9GAMM|nr:hypothetical protein PSECIP111951_02235 [Pseudoalteromonas sp. CIP111951]
MEVDFLLFCYFVISNGIDMEGVSNLFPISLKRLSKFTLLIVTLLSFYTYGQEVGVFEPLNEPVVIPEPPTLNIKTTGIEAITNKEGKKEFQYTAPHIPAIRTSNDGRIGLFLKRLGTGNPRNLTVLRPEAVERPFSTLEPGIPKGFLSDLRLENIGHGHHLALCDGSSVFSDNNTVSNPKQCSSNPENDCYELSAIGSKTDKSGTKVVRSKFSVEVQYPKTKNAKIVKVTYNSQDDVESNLMPDVSRFLEPMVTADGRLFVFRINEGRDTKPLKWKTDDGTEKSGLYDMVYAVIPESENACDITKLQGPYPISHAPFHSLVKNKYGFAQRQFRDPEGSLIKDGEPIKGTYPWVDREGRNVFFTAIRSMLNYSNHGVEYTRYKTSCVEGCSEAVSRVESGLHTQGVVAMGAWTNGKMVLLDGAFANSDYGLSTTNHKYLTLYRDVQGQDVMEVVGSARSTERDKLPLMGAKNTTFIDSLENLFNYNSNMVPSTPRDVVWHLSTGRGTADVAFDDFINKHSVIVANMNASLTHDIEDEGPIKRWEIRNHLHMRHNDGFQTRYNFGGKGFFRYGDSTLSDYEAPRIQNAATGSNDFTPDYGHTHGNVRIEPIAKGGIIGKGLWLDGESGVSFSIGKALDEAFITLFVDPRQNDSEESKTLLTFADQSTLRLSHKTLSYLVEGSTKIGYVFEVDLTAFAFTDKQWRHIALQVNKFEGGTVKINVFLNGYLLTQWNTPIHQPFSAGDTVLGSLKGSADGIRGWVDEFKVFAYRPDLESVCNHGHGTIVGINTKQDNEKWWNEANKYGATTHEVVSKSISAKLFSRYACLHNYSEEHGFAKEKAANSLLFSKTDDHSLRQILLFPEGPLFWDMQRPDSSKNSFCLECHDSENHFTPLSVAALISQDVTTQMDKRRQPMQPLRLMMGNTPELFDKCQFNELIGSTLVDECVLGTPRRVESHKKYRIKHVATGLPLFVQNIARHGYPLKLTTREASDCNANKCDFWVEDLDNGYQGIKFIDVDLGHKSPIGVVSDNIDKKLRRSISSNCGSFTWRCDFTIIEVGHDHFQIQSGDMALTNIQGVAVFIPHNECRGLQCEFQFIVQESR